MASALGIRAGRAYVELNVNTSALKSGLSKAQAACEKFAQNAASKLQFGASIAAPVAVAVKQFAAFDDQMRLVQGVTGATGKEFDSLTQKAKQLGATTSWTAAQVAEGMTSLGRAGFSTNEIDDSIQGVMNLARATGSEIEAATDIAGNALRSFGLDASEMGRVCDVLSATANGSAQTLEDLGEAFKYVAPIAASTGLTIEDTAKIVGALANFGVKGSQAGTVFKNIQTRMATDSNAQKKYAELGIKTTDESGNLRKINDVLLELGKTVQNMPSAERLETIKTLFGQYGLTGVSLTTADFSALSDAIDNASGAAAETAQKMDDGIGGAMRITQSAVEGLALSIGESLVPYLTQLAEKIQGVSAWLTDFNNKHPGVIENVAKFATKILAIQGGFFLAAKAASFFIGKIQTTISVVQTAFKVGQSAINGLAKASEWLVGVQKTRQASLQALASYQSSLFGLEQAGIAVNTAKTASEKAAAVANYATAQSEVVSARAALDAANAKSISAAASAKAIAATLALTAGVAIVAGLAAAYVYWATGAERAAESAKKATDAQERFSQQRAEQRENDRQLFEELKQLEQQQALSNDQMARAKYIVAELTDHYGDLGVKVDEAARKIYGAANAQQAFNEAQKKQEIQDIKNDIATMEAERKRLQKAIDANQKFVYGFGNAVASGFSSTRMLEKYQEKVDRIAELDRKIRGAQNKLELARGSSETVAQIEQNRQLGSFQLPNLTPEIQPEKNEPFSPEIQPEKNEPFSQEIQPEKNEPFSQEIQPEVNSVVEGIKQIAEKFQPENAPTFDVEAPEINVPGVDVEEFQAAANDAVDVAEKTESKGTFNAFEAIDMSNDQAVTQTNLLRRQNDYLRETRDLLKNADSEFV